jgi:hypothetical protein
LTLDVDALRPLISAAVEETMRRIKEAEATLGDRLAYPEAEAAALIGIHSHQLRDERLRGRISASRIVGKRVVYTRDDLIRYVMAQRENDPAAPAR